jgi:hypothetical protein
VLLPLRPKLVVENHLGRGRRLFGQESSIVDDQKKLPASAAPNFCAPSAAALKLPPRTLTDIVRQVEGIAERADQIARQIHPQVKASDPASGFLARAAMSMRDLNTMMIGALAALPPDLRERLQ